MELLSLEAAWAILAIILIDIVLAGDNALVIGMAANRLPPDLRQRAIWAGTAGALLVRIASVAVLTWLLTVPGLRLAGAVALIWIGWRLTQASAHSGIQPATTFWGAMATIVLADAVMGIDNALAIAAAAQGDFALVILGLLISVPIILFGATMVTRILARWPDAVFVGSAVLFAVALQMAVKEPLLAHWFSHGADWAVAALPWAGALVLTALQYNATRLHLRRSHWRHK
jgi:YjbE family integral membrane protein|nr:TerC family protein [Oxalobacteraceae bacterium]